MRKRVKLCLISILIILLLPVIAAVLLYNSDWAKEINYDHTFTSSQLFELEFQKNKDHFAAMYMSEGDAAFEVCFDVQEIKGCVNVTIYGGYANPNDDGYKKLMNSEHEIIRFQLTEVGRKTYSISDTKYSCYIVFKELAEGSESITMDEKISVWHTNWECLLQKLGINKGNEIGIGNIRMTVE